MDVCESPPCFGGGGLPGPSDLPAVLPAVLPVLVDGLAIALGLPSVLAAGWNLLRGRWAAGWRRLLALAGPVQFLIGTEVVPHALSPCLPAERSAGWQPGVCERQAHGGADVGDRWHALDHALVGAVPMAVLYRLRRSRPD